MPLPQPKTAWQECTHQCLPSQAWSTRGHTCDQCGTWRRRGCHSHRCPACNIDLCPKCWRSKRQQGRDRDPQPERGAATPAHPPGHHWSTLASAADAADWEIEIGSFPSHPAGGTKRWIPKGMARRYAACRLRVLDWAMDAETSSPNLPAHRVEAWSRLALFLPYLLLHEIPSAHDRPPLGKGHEGDDAQPGVRKLLQRRLALAERGDLLVLLREASANERVARLRAAAAPLKECTRAEVLEHSAAKAEDGCLHAPGQRVRQSCRARRRQR